MARITKTEARRRAIVAYARKLDIIEDGVCEIDDNAKLSEPKKGEDGDNGAYLQAWIWVPFDGTDWDKESKA